MDKSVTLNVFEQRPCWERLVTNVALCFQLNETADTTVIIGNLQDALDSLICGFPWLAGQVVNEGRNIEEGNTGVYKIVPGNNRPAIIVKDHRRTPAVPSIQSLRQCGYAVAALDQSVFAPRAAAAISPPKERPVLLIQANFISGGLVLVFSGDHAAMDGPGQYQIMRWFSKARHHEAFTPSELEVGNMSRHNMIPLLDSTYQQGEELAPLIPLPSNAAAQLPRMPSTWATFHISPHAVNEIKTLAISTCTTPYISTDDSLTAFIWQATSRARLHRLKDTSKTSSAVRSIDVRKSLNLPPTYPGLLQNNLFHTLSLAQLSTLPLGIIASLFRETLTRPAPSLEFYTRALATALSRSADKNAFRVAANLDLSVDLLITSSTSAGAYELDLAMGLGAPEAVRLTHQPTFEGIVYLLPMTTEGDVTVVVCLRNEDLAALVVDDEGFGRYARHVG